MFEGAIGEQCVIVTVADGDNTNMGKSLILERSREMSSVPVEIYPNIVSLLIIDDDVQGNHTSIQVEEGGVLYRLFSCLHDECFQNADTSFSIISPQPVITVLEGSRINVIQVQRVEDTILTYNITLMVTALIIGTSMFSINQ